MRKHPSCTQRGDGTGVYMRAGGPGGTPTNSPGRGQEQDCAVLLGQGGVYSPGSLLSPMGYSPGSLLSPMGYSLGYPRYEAPLPG